MATNDVVKQQQQRGQDVGRQADRPDRQTDRQAGWQRQRDRDETEIDSLLGQLRQDV